MSRQAATWRCRLIAGAALAALIAGCGGDSGSDEDNREESSGPSKATLECAEDTYRARSALSTIDAQAHASGGITQAVYLAHLGQLRDEHESAADAIERCPEEVKTALEAAVSDFTGAGAVFEACDRKCSDAETAEIIGLWGDGSKQRRAVDTALGDEAVTAARDGFEATALDHAYAGCLDSVKAGEYRSAAIEYMELRDAGTTLSVGRPDDFASDDAKVVYCLLEQLDAPSSVQALMESTTALMGRQESEWDNITVSWSYHPDSGIDAVFEETT